MEEKEEKREGDWSMVLPLLMTMFSTPKPSILENQVAYLNGKVEVLEKIIIEKEKA